MPRAVCRPVNTSKTEMPDRNGGGAGQAHQAGHALGQDVVAGQGCALARAEAADRGVDDRGIVGGDAVVVQAEAPQAAGLEVLDEDVGPGGQLVSHRVVLFVAQVQGDRPLIAVDPQVVRADVIAAGRHPLPGVVAGRALHLDDVSAQVGQHHRGVRAGQPPGEGGDQEAGQCSLRVLVGCHLRVCSSDRYTDTCPPMLSLAATSACGRDCHSAQSAEISPAARISRGRDSSTSVATLVSAACTVTFMAARTSPQPSRTGTATERMPGASSSSARAQPRARTVRSSSSMACWPGSAVGGRPERLGSASVAASVAASSAASSTLPWEVCQAGNRVPITTRSVMILGTETRDTYTMS